MRRSKQLSMDAMLQHIQHGASWTTLSGQWALGIVKMLQSYTICLNIVSSYLVNDLASIVLTSNRLIAGEHPKSQLHFCVILSERGDTPKGLL